MRIVRRVAAVFSVVLFFSAIVAARGQDNPIPDSGGRGHLPEIIFAGVLHRVEPEYTPEARAAGLQGWVILYLLVSPSGELSKVEVIQSLGLGLDEKAIEAVKQWQFEPGARGGQPDWMAQCVEVEFRLDSARSWEISHSSLRVSHPKTQGVTERPTLRQYSRPAPNACRSEGATLVASLKVNKEGEPFDVALVEQSGEADNNAILAAIRGWRFEPGRLNGKPKEASGRIELECRSSPSETAIGGAENSEAVSSLDPEISPPALLYKIEPEYPEEARRAGFQGKAMLFIDVDETGYAINVRMMRQLGLGLDEKAAEAVYQWRFKPATVGGVPVTLPCMVEVNFRLR